MFPNLLCRPAFPADTPAVIELATQIWDGNDYLPAVWESWLADSNNHLFVAQLGAEIAGTINLHQLATDQWFLAALRIHPKFQGRGFSNRLFAHAIEDWQSRGPGRLRLITASFRAPVHHLCAKHAFNKIAEIRCCRAQPLAEPEQEIDPIPFSEAANILARFSQNPLLPPALNLVDLAWEYAQPTLEMIQNALQAGLGFTWRAGRGDFLIFYDEYDGHQFPYLAAITCNPTDLPVMLLAVRRWTAAHGFSALAWNCLQLSHLLRAQTEAGFQTDPGEELLYLYEKS